MSENFNNGAECPEVKCCIHARNAVGLRKLIQRFGARKMQETDLEDYGQDIGLLHSMLINLLPSVYFESISQSDLRKIIDIHEIIDKIGARIEPQAYYVLNHLPASEFAELEGQIIEQIKIWLAKNKI